MLPRQTRNPYKPARIRSAREYHRPAADAVGEVAADQRADYLAQVQRHPKQRQNGCRDARFRGTEQQKGVGRIRQRKDRDNYQKALEVAVEFAQREPDPVVYALDGFGIFPDKKDDDENADTTGMLAYRKTCCNSYASDWPVWRQVNADEGRAGETAPDDRRPG